MRTDHVGVVEAAYSTAADDAGWVSSLAEACRPLLDEGLGVGVWTYDISGTGAIQLLDRTVAGGPESLIERMDRWSREIDPSRIRRLYQTRSVGCMVASQRLGRVTLAADGATQRNLHPVGVRDMMAATTPDPDGCGVGVVAFYPKTKSVPRRTAEMWGRIGAHLAAAYRLRRRNSAGEQAVDAVLDPGGKLLHAETAAKSSAARERLREAALSMDRARSLQGRANSPDAVAAWRALVAGQWTLVDRFEADGRRFVVARRNDPAGMQRSELSNRETQIAGYAALGHSNKLIAYSLGVSESVVSERLGNVLSKLGLRSRAELMKVLAELQRVPAAEP